MVNLELYRVFYTVARCGSLTKAAEELYISQPAVSQAIKQLETQLGTPLFNRMHKGMELSAQGGELVFADVEKALQLLGGVEDRLSELKQSATGTLRIGASETIFQYVLADKIVEYHKLYPQVKIDLISDVSPKIIDCLKTDRCDVGFLNLPIEPDEGIRLTESVALLNDVFVAGEAFAELKGRELSVWDLQNYPLLLLEPHTIARAAVDHYAESLGVHFQPAVEVDSWGFMKKLVTEGMGIGCIPREYALRRLEAGELFELNVTPAMPSRSVGLALPKNANMPFSLRAFINLFKKKGPPRRFSYYGLYAGLYESEKKTGDDAVSFGRKAVSFLRKNDEFGMRINFLRAFAVREGDDVVIFSVQNENVAGVVPDQREGVECPDALEECPPQLHAP